VARQCQLIGLARSSWYYRPLAESADNLVLMREIDRLCLNRPFFGTRKVREHFDIAPKRTQHPMRLFGLEAMCPRIKPRRQPIKSLVQLPTRHLGVDVSAQERQPYAVDGPVVLPEVLVVDTLIADDVLPSLEKWVFSKICG